MCKKCFAFCREHNRCKFQHIGPPPRAPTAIAASRARRGHRLRDPNLGCASAPCGRPAPDPAGLRRQKRPARGPRRKLEPRGREGGAARRRGPGWGSMGLGPPRGAAPRPARARVPPRGGPPGPTWKGRRRKEGEESAGLPAAAAGPAPLPPRPPPSARASRAGPGQRVPAAPGPLARPPRQCALSRSH